MCLRNPWKISKKGSDGDHTNMIKPDAKGVARIQLFWFFPHSSDWAALPTLPACTSETCLAGAAVPNTAGGKLQRIHPDRNGSEGLQMEVHTGAVDFFPTRTKPTMACRQPVLFFLSLQRSNINMDPKWGWNALNMSPSLPFWCFCDSVISKQVVYYSVLDIDIGFEQKRKNGSK